MKTKKEIKEWLIENATNEYGDIKLNDIDFGERDIDLSGIKGDTIFNSEQIANKIKNDNQEILTQEEIKYNDVPMELKWEIFWIFLDSGNPHHYIGNDECDKLEHYYKLVEKYDFDYEKVDEEMKNY